MTDWPVKRKVLLILSLSANDYYAWTWGDALFVTIDTVAREPQGGVQFTEQESPSGLVPPGPGSRCEKITSFQLTPNRT